MPTARLIFYDGFGLGSAALQEEDEKDACDAQDISVSLVRGSK